jgi:hypothetical protein
VPRALYFYGAYATSIGTPEKRQPFGQVAKDHLSSLVEGQTVTVNYLKRDHYGRIVGKVLNGLPMSGIPKLTRESSTASTTVTRTSPSSP